jgi:hypothetical protein
MRIVQKISQITIPAIEQQFKVCCECHSEVVFRCHGHPKPSFAAGDVLVRNRQRYLGDSDHGCGSAGDRRERWSVADQRESGSGACSSRAFFLLRNVA